MKAGTWPTAQDDRLACAEKGLGNLMPPRTPKLFKAKVDFPVWVVPLR